MRRLCAGCGLHPARRATRRVPLPLYCRSCQWAEDQRPLDCDSRRESRGVVLSELEARRRRIQAGRALQARAERLLATLAGIDRWVWSMVVAGISERRIAARMGVTRQELYGWYLERLRLAAGLPARPRRYGRAA